MRIAKWLIVFLVALGFAIPNAPHIGFSSDAEAVELNLGGFPSYFRQRVRWLKNATFVNTLSQSQAESLGFGSNNDNAFWADTTFRVTPQLVLSDSVTIRTQVDIFSNNLWGGLNSDLLGGGATLVNSAISPQDRYRGALITGPAATDDNGFLEIRMLHIDMVLPNNLGFVRIGRQPFDWGIGILANGGWDPYSDLGFLIDRFLWLKTFPTGSSSLTLVVVSDIITEGNSLISGGGTGYDIGAAALIWNNPNISGINLTIGGYVFPYIHQNNFTFAGSAALPGAGTLSAPPSGNAFAKVGDLERFTLYAGLIDLKTDTWRLVGELQGGWGELEDFLGVSSVDISNQLLWAVRGEYYPSWPLKVVGAEFGWADGDKGSTGLTEDIEGNVIVFNPAYNLDNLLFKHMVPNIYQNAAGVLGRGDSSVQNAYYARAYGTVKLMDHLSFTPQVLIAWNEETTSIIAPGQNIGSYLGTEVEGTLTWTVHPGVNFDLIGSVVFAGSGLEDMLEQQAEVLLGEDPSDSAESTPFAIQGRLLVFIDQFFK